MKVESLVVFDNLVESGSYSAEMNGAVKISLPVATIDQELSVLASITSRASEFGKRFKCGLESNLINGSRALSLIDTPSHPHELDSCI